MKATELYIIEAFPNDQPLRAELVRLVHVGERLETRLAGVGGALRDFVRDKGLNHLYSTDILLEELDELARSLTVSAHLVQSIHSQIAVLRMDRAVNKILAEQEEAARG